jgi:glycosyltransferase involved in cell wall biosynthesis
MSAIREVSYAFPAMQSLSVVVIAYNEEANLGRTLDTVRELVEESKGEIVLGDCGSTDRTVKIAQRYGAKIFLEVWQGYAAQKNAAIEHAKRDWVLSLDADESLEPGLIKEIREILDHPSDADGYWVPRKNFFMGRYIRHGGYYPDRKLRLFRRGKGKFGDRAVHETLRVNGKTTQLKHALIHNSYPTLEGYIADMNRYSSLGAEEAGKRGFSLFNIVVRPGVTFIYNYFLRLGFLDGREGFLLHLYHSVYVSWKYAKAWERSRKARRR